MHYAGAVINNTARCGTSARLHGSNSIDTVKSLLATATAAAGPACLFVWLSWRRLPGCLLIVVGASQWEKWVCRSLRCCCCCCCCCGLLSEAASAHTPLTNHLNALDRSANTRSVTIRVNAAAYKNFLLRTGHHRTGYLDIIITRSQFQEKRLFILQWRHSTRHYRYVF